MPPHLAPLARGHCAVAHLVHAQPPLLADERLDDGVAAVAVTDVVCVGLLFDEHPIALEVFDHELARFDAGQSVVAKAGDVHAPVRVHGVDHVQ